MRTTKFKVEAPRKLIIGDPWYFEHIDAGTDDGAEKNLVFIRKRMPKDMEVYVTVEEKEDSFDFDGKNVPFTTIIAKIIGVGPSAPLNKDRLRTALEEGKYHPSLLSKQGELGCDTARFVMETDYGYDEFHTGADGYYGNWFTYKNNAAYYFELSFDSDMFGYQEIAQRMKRLFKEEK